MSCGGKEHKKVTDSDSITVETRHKGDSMLYGLACDGCTDSVTVMLPDSGGDPVTFNIIRAMKQHKVMGRPTTGDRIAIMVNPNDRSRADMVIVIDELKGKWVNMVMPTVREKMHVHANETAEMIAEEDSVLQSLMVPKEMGFVLKNQYVAEPVGRQRSAGTLDDESPVVYPRVKRYAGWRLYNGKLLLQEGRSKASKRPLTTDTAEIVFLLKDSLRLRFKNDGKMVEKGFYRIKGKTVKG